MMIIYDTYVGIHIRIYNKEVLVMSASKDTKRGTWKVYIRYKDWQGIGQVHTKRGFATKREALEYEREFLLKKSKDVNMGFPQFVEVYMEDMKPRLKLNTFLTKKHIMETKIIPYFEKIAIIVHWLLFIIVIAGVAGVVGVLIVIVEKKITKVYRENCCDVISIGIAVISLAVVVYFGDWIKVLVKLNLVALLLLVQAVYVGIRAYVKGCKRARGYY